MDGDCRFILSSRHSICNPKLFTIQYFDETVTDYCNGYLVISNKYKQYLKNKVKARPKHLEEGQKVGCLIGYSNFPIFEENAEIFFNSGLEDGLANTKIKSFRIRAQSYKTDIIFPVILQ